MATRPPSSTIFVGNLPFEVTEADLAEHFSQVGPVKSFRIVTDKETNRPKGFGFCEFYDQATAESAHRNLNGAEFRGRNLRIDFAEDFQTKRENRAAAGDGRPPMAPGYGAAGSKAIGLPAAESAAVTVAQLLGGPASSDPQVMQQLNAAFAKMSKAELYDVMAQMKALISGDRAGARQYFIQRPWLTKVLFQGQVLLGMVQPPPPAVEPPAGMPPQPAAGYVPPGAPTPPYGQPPPPMQPGYQMGGPPAGVPPPPQPPPMGMPPGQMMQPAPPAYGAMLPVAPPPPVAPPMQQQQQPPAAPAAPLQDQAMAAVVRQVMSLTDEQIAALQPEHRQQVLFVKEQIATGKLPMPL